MEPLLFTRADLFVLRTALAMFDDASNELFEATSPSLPSRVTKARAKAERALAIQAQNRSAGALTKPSGTSWP